MLKQLVLFSLLGLVLAAPNSKIEPRLARSLRSNSLVNIFVKFGNGHKDIYNGVHSLRFNTRGDKTTHMVAALKSLSQISQRNAVEMLQNVPQFAYSAMTFKQFWISNELYVKGANAEAIRQLEALSEVSKIREEVVIVMDDIEGDRSPHAIWNLEQIEATSAWQLPGGNNGRGVVIGGIDTGVRHTHVALAHNFRKDYGWLDPYDGTEEPSDLIGHGTHTIGTAVGAQIGVAPGAQWIACVACPFGGCPEAELKACGQWMLCPTRANGTSEDCSKAPNVVTNSWGGRGGNEFYNDIIDAWKAADIIPVFAQGNEGPACGTAHSPGDQAVIAVGSTTENDDISRFSSAGPTTKGGIKPNFVAPGSNIFSAGAQSDGDYLVMSGTSMACPHGAGAVALLLSRNPNLKYDQVLELLTENTDTNLIDTGVACGGINSTVFPNNQFGHGRLNARKALEAAIRSF